MVVPPALAERRGVRVVTDAAEVQTEVRAAREAGRRVGFVPTMGGLHAGHVSLVARAVAECDDVAVSIFVNPAQFGPGEDFDRYPRDLAGDLATLAGGLGKQAAGKVRWIFAPAAEVIYPPGHATRIVVAGPANRFEGAARRGHFSGVATVVCRLFQIVPAEVAYFGAKDWQQALVVKRMVADLGLPIGIVVCPTVREPDGLAMSSRNAFLSPDDRRRAVALSESLRLAEDLWHDGVNTAEVAAGMKRHMRSCGIAVDYAAVVDAETLGPVVGSARAVALVAGRAGTTRLIDNRLLPGREDGAAGQVGWDA